MSDIDAILLAGPTASGKTDLALALAARAPIEIVSVDSSQVYRGFDIGAAKPDATIRAQVPHHLIDIREPHETYSAGEFVEDAIAAIRDIRSRGRMPVLVGGTMLYFNALIRGIATLPTADPGTSKTNRCACGKAGLARAARRARTGRSRCCGAHSSERSAADPARARGL